MRVPIRNLGQFGVNLDLPAHTLPANMWTDARGVRFYDNAVWKAYGQVEVLDTPEIDPYYVYRHLGPSTILWAYPGLAKVYATDGSTHGDITRTSGGDYTGDADNIWQGCHLGGIEIFNNGIDDPQAWINPGLGQELIDLANWPANHSARVIKSFKQHLIAFDVTKSGTRYPYLIKWSHPADPGSVPSSWDHNDETLDAGEYPLADTGGYIKDALTLQDSLMVYKEDQTWAMNLVGGRFIFDIKQRFDTGVASPRSIIQHKARHYVALLDDVIMHDGFQQESILDDKMRRWLDGQVDSDYINRQYMVFNSRENELWLCMPRAGQTHPDIALIINIKDGTNTLRDLPNPTYITAAPLDPNAGSTTFDSQLITFDQMVGTFGQRSTKPGANRLIGAHRGGRRFLMYDTTFADEGEPFRAYCERLSVPLAGIGRDGSPHLDETYIKQVNEIWPQVRMQGGNGINIYVGGQDHLQQAVNWSGPFPFMPGVDDKIDCNVTGRYLSFRFESTDSAQWKLDSYTVNVEQLGEQ